MRKYRIIIKVNSIWRKKSSLLLAVSSKYKSLLYSYGMRYLVLVIFSMGSIFVSLVGCAMHQSSHASMSPVMGLPASFPISEVPLVSGQVVEGGNFYDAEKKTWNFTVLATGNNILPRAKKLLLAAGFQLKSTNAAPIANGVDMVMIFWSKKYIVTVGSSTTTYTPEIHYLVTNTSLVTPPPSATAPTLPPVPGISGVPMRK